jgi:hypothetical protein
MVHQRGPEHWCHGPPTQRSIHCHPLWQAALGAFHRLGHAEKSSLRRQSLFWENGELRAPKITRSLRQKGGYARRCSAKKERERSQWIEIAVPALVSRETFALAQERLAQNKRLSLRNTKEPTLLQGLLVCEQCGYALYRTCAESRVNSIASIA